MEKLQQAVLLNCHPFLDYRARYYSLELGRFISRDPIGYADGMNLYAYVKNNPVNYIDPTGLKLDKGCFAKCMAACVIPAIGTAGKICTGCKKLLVPKLIAICIVGCLAAVAAVLCTPICMDHCYKPEC